MSNHIGDANKMVAAAPGIDSAEVLRRIDQADVALGCAGLSEHNILRSELREARAAVATLTDASPKGGSDKAEAHALMAAEYQRWIDFFHAGNGDFNDFLRKELPEEPMQATSAEVGS